MRQMYGMRVAEVNRSRVGIGKFRYKCNKDSTNDSKMYTGVWIREVFLASIVGFVCFI